MTLLLKSLLLEHRLSAPQHLDCRLVKTCLALSAFVRLHGLLLVQRQSLHLRTLRFSFLEVVLTYFAALLLLFRSYLLTYGCRLRGFRWQVRLYTSPVLVFSNACCADRSFNCINTVYESVKYVRSLDILGCACNSLKPHQLASTRRFNNWFAVVFVVSEAPTRRQQFVGEWSRQAPQTTQSVQPSLTKARCLCFFVPVKLIVHF
jgi:hypothetical protein